MQPVLTLKTLLELDPQKLIEARINNQLTPNANQLLSKDLLPLNPFPLLNSDNKKTSAERENNAIDLVQKHIKHAIKPFKDLASTNSVFDPIASPMQMQDSLTTETVQERNEPDRQSQQITET
ncbi:hypothetical protein Dimus_001082 [Dionaea muscipula]